MIDPNITSKYPIGTEPGIHFLPYLVIVSYIVSLIGAFTTVELLHRRNVGAGWQNWIQLGSCSVSFGLVAIWCMHFIGNRAIILGNGEQEIQLYYSPVFTTVSATLPIVVVFMGLMIGDHFHRGNQGLVTRFLALLITGASAGAAVTGMHYLGNRGTTNYYVKPKAAYLVGAATIAIGACIISFGLFFHWHSHWMNTPWRRFMTAVFLAIAVSGMHWTAAAGTRYEVRSYHIKLGRARDVNTIVATCLCLGACSVCFALGILRQRRLRKLKDRAQQVVLAAAMFDGKGRLLVTQSGLMPCQIIARQFHHKEDLDTAHPVVQWLFRVSRHWAGIVELVPLMRDHLCSTGHLQTHSSVIDIGTRPSEIEDDSNFFSTFRELFCVTAQNIANNLGLGLRDLGQLYDDVLTTGTLSTNTTTIRNHVNGNKEKIADEAAVSQADVEEFSNPALSAKGQLLVLTKKVTLEESYSLQDAGYRFAHLDQVGDVLARSLQVSRNDLNSMIAGLQSYCDRKPWTPSKGTYLVAFLLHSSPGLKRMDVIVPKHAPDRLPMVELDAEGLKPWQINLLKQYDGMTIDECLSRITRGYGAQTEHEVHWLEHFCNSLHLLTEEVPDPSLRHATFSPRMLKVAYSSIGLNRCQATVIAFCGVREIYSQTLSAKTLKWVPFSFFQCQQRAYPGRPDHAILARRNYKEFITLPNAALDHRRLHVPSTSKRTGKWPFVALSSKSDLRLNPDNSSVKELVQSPSNQHASTDNPANPFGSIMISRDITISDTSKDSCLVEMNDMGLHSEAGIADIEEQTMADELMTLTISMRNGHMKDNSGRRWV